MFLLKGQLHSVTQKGFGRQDGPQEKSPGLKRSVGQSERVVNRLSADITRVLQSPDIKAKLRSLGFEAKGGTSEAATQFVRSETAKWTKVIQDAGIEPMCFPVSLRPPVLRFIVCRGDQPPTMDSLRRVRAHPGDPKGRGKESRQDGRPPAPRRTCCKRRASER